MFTIRVSKRSVLTWLVIGAASAIASAIWTFLYLGHVLDEM